jgi:putative membrane protein
MQETLKAMHFIGFITWFAALFYLVRIMVYWVEAGQKEEPVRSAMREQFTTMARRLHYFIGVPGMVLTLTFGIWLLVKRSYLLDVETAGSAWMHIKLGLLFILVVYHHLCGFLVKQMKRGTLGLSSTQLRLLNEVPTVILVAIIFLAIKKNTTDWWVALLWLLGIMAVLFTVSILVRRARKK